VTTYPCPVCRTPANPVTGCPGCGRGPDPDAAEVIRLDAEIGLLNARLATARSAVSMLDGQLRRAWQLRHAAAARVRAKMPSATPPPPGIPFGRPSATPAPAGMPFEPRSAGGPFGPPAKTSSSPSAFAAGVPALLNEPPRRDREASTRLVQNSLFLLGGLLLAVAAIVFTAVAWSQFGVGGRALLLAAFTGAALAAPPIAQHRGLTATAETFAAVGLLLVLLDGYAAWYVDLFGVADYSAFGYAGAVCAVTAAVAAGYDHLTGLAGPRFVALAVAQPVLPLSVVELHFQATGWAFTFAAVALIDLAVVHLRPPAPTARDHAGAHPRLPAQTTGDSAGVHPRLPAQTTGDNAGVHPRLLAQTARDRLRPLTHTPGSRAGSRPVLTPVGIVAYALGGCFGGFAGGAALIAVALASRPLPALAAGAALVSVALVVLAAAVLAGVAGLRHFASGLLVVAVAVAASRFADVAAGRHFAPVLIPAVATVLAFLVLLVPAGSRCGPRIGALAVAGPLAVKVLAGVLWAAARPFSTDGDWRQPTALVLLVTALTVLLPAAWRRTGVLIGIALFALAAPAGFGLPWWSGPALELAVAGLVLALVVRAVRAFGLRLMVVGSLAVHAIAVSLERPLVAGLTLSAIALLGFGAAVAAWSGPRRDDVGGVSLAVGLLALPAVAGTVPMVPARFALGAVALIFAGLPLVARQWSAYRHFALAAALLAVVSGPGWAALAGDPVAVYSGIALVLVATTLPAPRWWVIPAVIPLGLALLAATGASQLVLLAEPYGWLDRIWSGHPGGTGLGRIAAGDVLGAGLLAVAAGLGAYRLRGGRAAGWAVAPGVGGAAKSVISWAVAPVVALVIPGALAAAEAPWPTVPAAMLLVGLGGLLTIALRSPHWAAAVPLGAVSGLLVPAGLAAALPTQWSTLAALAAVLLAGTVAGISARDLPARLSGWSGAVGAGLAFAFTAGRAFELALSATAFPVLGAAGVSLAAGALLTRRRPIEARAVQAAAHGGAVLALLLTIGDARFAAAVGTLWGLAIGGRALRPGEAASTRRLLVVAAAACELGGWLLLAAADRVSVLEAYTGPVGLVALLAGWLARRTRRDLGSWAAYGPALTAVLLPSLASILVEPQQPVRRLLLGLAALAVVLLGARARLRAPVVIGGSVLALVALHEIALVWDLLPRWIPLGAAGLLLIALAMTLERRRRDLARVRAMLTRMT
jgi:hypothetical protein